MPLETRTRALFEDTKRESKRLSFFPTCYLLKEKLHHPQAPSILGTQGIPKDAFTPESFIIMDI